MILPVFSAVLLLIGIIALAGKKNERRINEQMNAFWERERSANSVRRKPLDDLEELHIPEEFYSFPSDPDAHDCSEALRILGSLREERIVNLTGLTNTDLKERYGAANLPELSRCDQNYTSLVRALQMYAEWLSKNAHEAEAIKLLEYALDTRTDVSASWRLLMQLYLSAGRTADADTLLERADRLDSLTAPSLRRSLRELREK